MEHISGRFKLNAEFSSPETGQGFSWFGVHGMAKPVPNIQHSKIVRACILKKVFMMTKPTIAEVAWKKFSLNQGDAIHSPA
jgi:hypothetical protein